MIVRELEVIMNMICKQCIIDNMSLGCLEKNEDIGGEFYYWVCIFLEVFFRCNVEI